MEHTWSKNHPQYCTACMTWIPKGTCLGKPRNTQVTPPLSEDPTDEAKAQTRYERQFGW
jgi:hypothetical protein